MVDVRLRELEDADLDAVHRRAADPEVCRCTDRGPNSLDDTRYLRDAAQAPRREWALAVVLDDVLVGTCAVWRDADGPVLAHLGHVVDPRWWGRGVATAATRGLLQLATDELGAARVEATCRPQSTASAAVLRRAGVREVGRLRDRVVRGRPADPLLFRWEDR